MKKWELIIAALGLLFFSVGCNKVTSSKSSTPKVEKSIDYTQLSDSEKSEMTFVFTRNEMSEATSVDLKVVNRTSKNIEFNGERFILIHKDGNEVDSDLEKTIVVKSNSTKTVKNLFSDIESDNFEKVGLYCYRNTQYHLAYSEINKTSSKSTNLKDETLQKAYLAKKKKVSAATTDKQTQPKRPAKPLVPTGPITNSKQAMALVESQYGPAPDGSFYSYMTDETSDATGSIKLSDGTVVFWVRLAKNGNGVSIAEDDWTVYPDRTVIHMAPSRLDQNNNSNDDNNNNGSTSDDFSDDNDDQTDFDTNDDYNDDQD